MWQGGQYIREIQRQSPELLDQINLFKSNDLIGKPILYEYRQPIGKISPTTLSYVKIASDIKCLFPGLNDCLIAEVGCGYGGQLLVMDKVIPFRSYTIFDLPPVLTLASKYIECHILRGSYLCATLNEWEGNIDFDLLISNYAFSELPAHLQRMYITKILMRAKRGYLIMNSGLRRDERTSNKLNLAQLRELLPPFQVIHERPLTGPNNYVITWGHDWSLTSTAGGRYAVVPADCWG
jgi:hypothetical protein